MIDLNALSNIMRDILSKLINISLLEKEKIIVIGCSTSEIAGEKIGTASNEDIAQAIMSGILGTIREKNLYLAVQSCEHLNRALVIEKACCNKYNLDEVSVVPTQKAGGALSIIAMKQFTEPVIVESIQAHAGIDIGNTMIGMHLKNVAVPIRLPYKKVGQANLVLARTRPKLIGGERASYKYDIGK